MCAVAIEYVLALAIILLTFPWATCIYIVAQHYTSFWHNFISMHACSSHIIFDNIEYCSTAAKCAMKEAIFSHRHIVLFLWQCILNLLAKTLCSIALYFWIGSLLMPIVVIRLNTNSNLRSIICYDKSWYYSVTRKSIRTFNILLTDSAWNAEISTIVKIVIITV